MLRRRTMLLCAAVLPWLADSTGLWAGETKGKSAHGHAHETRTHVSTSCDINISLAQDAERQPGGAFYTGPIPKKHHRSHETLPAMQGAHMQHKPQYGGLGFFMAPDQLHHLEPLYSDTCGFRVILYNAFSRPISVRRFRAFIRIIPEDQSIPEMIRFLSPSADGALLQTAIGSPVPKPFEIELYVKFPESEEPELFNVFVSARSP